MTYTKYSASGNDFVIFHSFIEKDFTEDAIRLCNRTQGIGADGFVAILPSDEADFKWKFYNSDGSDAAMCGNATRAVAHYAYNNNLAPLKMKFLTKAGLIESEVFEETGNIVETQMTKPVVVKEAFEEEGFTWYLIDTGVPHLVTIVDDLQKYDYDLCAKMRFKYNANVNFAKVENNKINNEKILKVRTYERGVEGETLACGTGMVACFLRSLDLGLIPNKIFVYPKSQEELSISKIEDKIYFKGAVKKVFTAII